jgi:hypothetical protein
MKKWQVYFDKPGSIPFLAGTKHYKKKSTALTKAKTAQKKGWISSIRTFYPNMGWGSWKKLF